MSSASRVCIAKFRAIAEVFCSARADSLCREKNPTAVKGIKQTDVIKKLIKL
jgi:hypothetical protein